MSEMVIPGSPSQSEVIAAALAGNPLPVMPVDPNRSQGDIMADTLSAFADGHEPAAAPVEQVQIPVVEQAAEPVVPVVPAVDVDAPAGELPNRFRFSTDEDKAVAMLARSRGVSLVEAARIYADSAPVAEAAAVVPDVIATKEARLGEIEAAFDKLTEEAGDVGYTITPEIRALQKEQAALLRELPVLQVEAKQAEDREERQFLRQDAIDFTKWNDEAGKDFPEMLVPGSAMFRAVEEEAAKVSDPTHPFWGAPDRAYLVAARAAKRIGYVPAVALPGGDPAKPAAAAPAALQTQQALPRAMGVVPGAATSSTPRITVATGPASAVDLLKQGIAAVGNAGREGVRAGLELIISGGAAPQNQPKLW